MVTVMDEPFGANWPCTRDQGPKRMSEDSRLKPLTSVPLRPRFKVFPDLVMIMGMTTPAAKFSNWKVCICPPGTTPGVFPYQASPLLKNQVLETT
jgi:hypothetical protein